MKFACYLAIVLLTPVAMAVATAFAPFVAAYCWLSKWSDHFWPKT